MRTKKKWLATIAVLLCCLAAKAESFKVGDFCYNIIDSVALEVEVAYNKDNQYSGEVSVPSTIVYDGTKYSVTSIGAWAFYNKAMTKVILPEGIVLIDKYAFQGCANLKEITFPVSLKEIGTYAFIDCSALAKIVVKGEKPMWDMAGYPFMRIAYGAIMYVPKNLYDDYYMGETSVILPIYSVEGYVFESNGIRYNIGHEPNTVEVTMGKSPNQYSGDITIPASVTYNGVTYKVTAIGSQAFLDCVDLTNISLPKGLQNIGDKTFSGCTSLTHVVLPEGVISTGDYVGCTNLVSITIPEGVRNIGSFEGCTGLTNITFPESVEHISSYNFEGCVGLTSITIPGRVETVQYSVFQGCSGLKSVTLKEGVKCIRSASFNGCANLTELTLPNSLEFIDEWAFYGCKSLTSVTIPANVTSIGNSAFANCSSLTSVIIPESVTTLGDKAFGNCPSLAKVTSEAAVPPVAHSNTFINISADAVLYVPEGAEDAYNSALGWSIFGYINDQPIEMEEYSMLHYNILPDGKSVEVTHTGEGSNSYWGDIVIPATVTIDGIQYDVTAIGDGAFRGSNRLKSVTIPSCVTSIGDNAFYGCDSLVSVTIPENVEKIGYRAIYDCRNIEKIIVNRAIPATADDGAFGGIEKAILYVPKGTRELYAQSTGWSSIYLITEGNLFETGGLFYNPTGESTVEVIASQSSKVVYSGDVVIPSAVTDGESEYVVTAIGNMAFQDCSGLTSVSIPSGVTHIGRISFGGCSSLASVSIPSSVTHIGSSAFKDCISLETIELPEGLETIEGGLCYGCEKLEGIIIPDGVTSIGGYAFRFCRRLRKVSIPANVKEIGYGAFTDAWLDAVVMEGTTPPIQYDAFDSGSELYVQKGAKEAYVAEGWDNFDVILEVDCDFANKGFFFNIIDAENKQVELAYRGNEDYNNGYCYLYSGDVIVPSQVANEGVTYDVVRIGDKTFSPSTYVTSVIIPEGVTSIGESAFNCCTKMTHVELPEGLLTIEKSAFDWCVSLSEISLPESVVSIGERAFLGCDFTEIKIPAGVTTIAPNTFQQCKYLTKVTLSANVDTIGMSAFSSCSSLTNIVIPASVKYIDKYAFSSCGPLTLIVSEATTPPVAFWGTFTGSENAILVVPNGCKELYQAADEWSQFYAKNIQEMQIGDINYDGAIDKDDALVLVNKLAEGVQCGDQITLAADINSDNVVNVVDVVAAINALIDSGMIPYPMKTRALSNDYLSVEDFTIYAGETKEVEIYLDNTKGYTAFQADIHLPEGLVLAENASLGSRASVSHMLVTCLSNANVLRTVAFSLLAEDFNSNDGCLVKFAVTAKKNFTGGTLSIENVMFATSDEDGYVLSDVTATIMGDTGLYDFINEDNNIVEYYNLQGVRVDSPAQGIYIKKQGDRVSKVLFR